MAFNINSFRSSLASEVANPTNYEVRVVGQPKTLQNNGRYSEFIKELPYRCETCSLPSKALKAANRMVYGPVRKVAYGAEYQDVSFSFIATDSMIEKEYFEAWQNTIVDNRETNSSSNNIEYYDNYIGEVSIAYYDKTGQKTYEIILEEAYPILVQETPLSWNSNNDYVRITVMMAFKSYREKT